MFKSDLTLDGTLIATLTPGSEKKVAMICDDCGRQSVVIFHNYVKGVKRWGDGKYFCRPCASKRTGAAKRGKAIKQVRSPLRQAERHSNWKGGRFVASDGYVQVYLAPRKYRKEHFLVMEAHLERALRVGEVVHHIDTDKTNNVLKNLVLLANEREHQAVHNSLRFLAGVLVQRGLIGFDREHNRYVAVGKLRELLGQPEEANQQPSGGGDAPEGSTTRCEPH